MYAKILPRLPFLGRFQPAPVEHPAFTMDALHRAWRSVRANRAIRGSPRIGIKRFEATLDTQLPVLQRELLDGSYRPRPVHHLFVDKQDPAARPKTLREIRQTADPDDPSKYRPLTIWAIRDRVAQRAVYNALEPLFEPTFLDCSHGFRPGRSIHTAIAQVRAGRDAGLRWVMETDITKCFDSIDVGLLLPLVSRCMRDPLLLRLVEMWMQMEIMGLDGHVHPAGTAQGSVLSPLLCNIYLHPFDVALTRQKLHLVRYADDLVVLCPTQPEAIKAQEITRNTLAALRLELKLAKTRICHFNQGFDFLGMRFKRDGCHPAPKKEKEHDDRLRA